MEQSLLALILAVLALAFSIIALLPRGKSASTQPTAEIRSLRLQAYERLVLLTERIALPNLISRLAQPGLTAGQMKLLLIENIKQEFDYNSTQQLYVSDIAWDSVRNLKEQNLAMIHQVSASLAAAATGSELSVVLLEVIMQQPGAPLHELVAKTLNQEAKILMK
jgi:hypothetical protein